MPAEPPDTQIESILFGANGIQISFVRAGEPTDMVVPIHTYTVQASAMAQMETEVEELLEAARDLLDRAHVLWRNSLDANRGR